MSHTPHELAEEFPEAVGIMHDLKLNNAHFATLADRYHHVNRTIHRLENRIETASDETERALRHERVKLKDEIAALIAAERATPV